MSSTTTRHARWIFWGLLAIAGYFFFAEHRAHAHEPWHYALAGACLLLLYLLMRLGGAPANDSDRTSGSASDPS